MRPSSASPRATTVFESPHSSVHDAGGNCLLTADDRSQVRICSPGLWSEPHSTGSPQVREDGERRSPEAPGLEPKLVGTKAWFWG